MAFGHTLQQDLPNRATPVWNTGAGLPWRPEHGVEVLPARTNNFKRLCPWITHGPRASMLLALDEYLSAERVPHAPGVSVIRADRVIGDQREDP